MKREIKFRGKRIDNEEWVEGFYYEDIYADQVNNDFAHTYWIRDHYDTNIWEVHPSTVGQYTGLKDKHGKEIYEGDIINIIESSEQSTNYGQVRFSDCEVHYMDASFWMRVPTLDGRASTPLRNNDNAEIIGSIHDTKEKVEWSF